MEDQVKLLDARLKDLTFRHEYLADSIAQRERGERIGSALRSHFLAGCCQGIAVACFIYALVLYFRRGE